MLIMRSHSLRLQHCASQHGCRMKTNPFLLDHQTLNKQTPLSDVDVFTRGCQQRMWIDVFFNCTPDNFELDQWKLNCAKHKTPCPSSVLPSVHTPALLFHIQPAPLSSPPCSAETQNKALMFFTTAPFHSHWCNIAPMTKQSPPFCQVRSTNNSVAAISQTLQRGHCTQVNAEQRHTVVTYFCRDVMVIITSNVRNKFWFCNNPSEGGLTFLSECSQHQVGKPCTFNCNMNPHLILARHVQVNSLPGHTTIYIHVFISCVIYNVIAAARFGCTIIKRRV